jgi:HTH-type transcriptional regulator / antitoxin HipB
LFVNSKIAIFTAKAIIIMIEPDLLAEIVRKHRKMAGLSQLQLADMAGWVRRLFLILKKEKQQSGSILCARYCQFLNIRVQLTSPLMDKITGNEKS